MNSASAKSAQLLHYLNENAEIAGKGESYMLDVCGQCGSVISKKLLRCSDGTAVFHHECANGHKLHRTTGNAEEQTTDWYDTSASFVTIEACDCN